MENIFKNLPDAGSREIFETLIAREDIKLERIVSYGQSTPEGQWLESDLNEWVLVLKGSARISFKDQKTIELQTGDYINITANRLHRVDWTDPRSETVWLALYY